MSIKRNQGRAASPTPTAFSGISNYRTESYRPKGNAPAVPQIDYRQVSNVHFLELSSYLAAYLAKAAPNSRSTARQKLTRLTIQQFHELSTDVYDELVRRKKDSEVPFLPVREEFHPKRNQARQKLATLPTSRFEDLSSDVYYELARRYPEFKEDPAGNTSNIDSDYPVSDFPSNSPPRATNNSRTSGRTSVDRPSDSGYGSHGSRRPSEDRRPEFMGRRSEDTFTPGRTSEDGGYAQSILSSRSNRRKPSQDTTGRRSEDTQRENLYARRQPSVSDSATTVNAQSSTATSGMVIPNKSTMEEEYIEVPYGRDQRESGSSTNPDEPEQEVVDNTLDVDDSASEYQSPGLNSPSVGLRGLNARLKGVEDDSGEESYGERFGRTSVGSDRSGSMRYGGRTSVTEAPEKMRQEYELKIAKMQTQISTLQRDLEDAGTKNRGMQGGEDRVHGLEDELASISRRAEEESSRALSLQKELEDLKETRQREKARETRRIQEDEEELQILRDRCEKLEEERENFQNSGGDFEAVEQLRNDMESLMQELQDLSKRNDELMSAKDADHQIIRELDMQMKDYKRKYEQAKTELRSVKATSQLFLQAPKQADDQLPVSQDGGILDIHMTTFLTGIDSLVTAGRSNAPTRVLVPMKSIINAVSLIVDDVRAFEKRPPRDRSDIDVDVLRSLRERAESTLSNLVAASKTHATSSGMSPVSLLDAAASHVSLTMTELAKTVFLRRATRAEQEQFASSSPIPNSSSSGFSPSLRSVDEMSNGHQRKPSSGPTARFADSPLGRGNTRRQAPTSDNSSSETTNSPPPIFDKPSLRADTTNNDEPVASDGIEDNWAELKPYLEAQTESIVYAIQAVLSGVRSPTPSPTLNENLTQIITIVSSIVAVCKDNLPSATAPQGTEILRELSEHATKLSEVQNLPEVTKESRQTMAKSSFAVANAMKGLMKL